MSGWEDQGTLGHRADEPPAHPSNRAPDPPSRSKASGLTVVVLVFGVVALVTAGVLLFVVLRRGGGSVATTNTPSTAQPATSGGAPLSATSAPIPSSTTDVAATGAEVLPTIATTTTEPPAVTATVVRTRGASGNGDGFLSRRAAPNSASAELGRLPEGSVVQVVCAVSGESVKSSLLPASTRVWARDTSGAYLSIAFLNVPGWDLYSATVPC